MQNPIMLAIILLASGLSLCAGSAALTLPRLASVQRRLGEQTDIRDEMLRQLADRNTDYTTQTKTVVNLREQLETARVGLNNARNALQVRTAERDRARQQITLMTVPPGTAPTPSPSPFAVPAPTPACVTTTDAELIEQLGRRTLMCQQLETELATQKAMNARVVETLAAQEIKLAERQRVIELQRATMLKAGAAETP